MDTKYLELKYEEGLKELSEELDGYLEGNWHKYDYLIYNERTKIRFLNENRLSVVFGVRVGGASIRQLSIIIKEFEDELIIRSIETFVKTPKSYSSYSIEVLSLLNRRIKGRTKKEIAIIELDKINKEIEEVEYNIGKLQERLIHEKDGHKVLKNKVKELSGILIK